MSDFSQINAKLASPFISFNQFKKTIANDPQVKARIKQNQKETLFAGFSRGTASDRTTFVSGWLFAIGFFLLFCICIPIVGGLFVGAIYYYWLVIAFKNGVYQEVYMETFARQMGWQWRRNPADRLSTVNVKM